MATFTAKEFAAKVDTDARTVRKFLRSHMEETPGKGSRYAIEGKQLRSLSAAFKKWENDRQIDKEIAEDLQEVSDEEAIEV